MSTSKPAPRRGLVLLGHGSPDPDWRAPLDALVDQLRERQADVPVELAFLGHGRTLDEAVTALEGADCASITVIAALISPGGKHVKVDMPALVSEVAAAHPDLVVDWEPDALGSDAGVQRAMADAVLRRLEQD